MKVLKYILFLLSVTATAQTISDFTLTNVIDGKVVTLKNYTSRAGVLVIFTSNQCPFDQYYLTRIKNLAKTFSESVPVILINSLTDATESSANMKTFAAKNNLSTPYLADKDQIALTMFDAKKSPEAFLLMNTGGKFSIAYRGAIDDNAQSETEVGVSYLSDAIAKLLAKETISESFVRPVGCSIRRN